MVTKEGTIRGVSEYGINIGGEWYNKDKGHPGALMGLKKDDYVRLEYRDNTGDNGKIFHNVSSATKTTPLEPVVEFQKVGAEEPFGPRPDKDRLIVRQCCIKAAATSTTVGTGAVVAEAVIETAEKFEEWVFR